MAEMLLESFKTFSDTSNLLRSLYKVNEATDCTENYGEDHGRNTIRHSDHNISSGCGSVNAVVKDGVNQFTSSLCPRSRGVYKNAEEEFQLIRSAHRTLTTTGCTPTFCQSGRATKVYETRIGVDRTLSETMTEAEQFLRECRDMGVIESDRLLDQRIESALSQIEATAVKTSFITKSHETVTEVVGGVWAQTSSELEYGLRAAWRNSKRCVMRSEHSKLILCDLRHVTTSSGMAHELIQHLTNAYNEGRIQPTAFVFPPRTPGTRGAMFWNEQLLAFAGYKQHDGSVLGDAKNIELTNAVIDFGWQPPSPRTRWDILPIVAMADQDKPYMIELPPHLARTVPITHPRFRKEFEQLDLRWVMFPALSRLGFDIGGLQYTAAPFLGWFMDAEVGVRNLADTSRYNVLPDVVAALNLSDRSDMALDDLPEYLRLAALSRAQTELNLAVYHSYEQEQVMMIDTMSASLNYMQFDDNHRAEKGYRLPADPYWLAPPQGSIVPLWHRGGAPNYQPKPLIARHAQDPIKAWRREYPNCVVKEVQSTPLVTKITIAQRRVSIFTCSDGITAGKLGKRLYKRLNSIKHTFQEALEVQSPQPLNSLTLSDRSCKDVILIVASTTGRGELPRNAQNFIAKHTNMPGLIDSPIFSIYGNGDSTHGDTYNAAPQIIEQFMSNLGTRNLMGSVFNGDTATQNPDWETFNRWVQYIEDFLSGHKKANDFEDLGLSSKSLSMADNMHKAVLMDKLQHSNEGLTLVTFDVGKLSYNETDHLKIVTPNPRTDVERVLDALGLQRNTRLNFRRIDAATFLEWDVDLSLGFRTLDWYKHITILERVEKVELLKSSVMTVLSMLRTKPHADVVEQILQDLHNIQPRHFSAASSMYHRGDQHGTSTKLDIITKFNRGGRVSDLWLNNALIGQDVRFCLARSENLALNYLQDCRVPLIVITTGSGIGPVRSILQRRITHFNRLTSSLPARSTMNQDNLSHSGNGYERFNDSTLESCETNSLPASSSASFCSSRCMSRLSSQSSFCADTSQQSHSATDCYGAISFFAGFNEQDLAMIEDIIHPGEELSLFDCLELCPSNPQKRRIQDHLLQSTVIEILSVKLQDPVCVVYICANGLAAEAARKNLSSIAGTEIRRLLGDRMIEEVFRG